MTDYNPDHLRILRFVKDHGRTVRKIDLINAIAQESRKGDFLDTSDRIEILIHRGCLSGKRSDEYVYLTPAGLDYLETLERISNQNAKEEVDNSFYKKLNVAQLLEGLVVFILGLLVEHWTSIVESFLSLFH